MSKPSQLHSSLRAANGDFYKLKFEGRATAVDDQHSHKGHRHSLFAMSGSRAATALSLSILTLHTPCCPTDRDKGASRRRVAVIYWPHLCLRGESRYEESKSGDAKTESESVTLMQAAVQLRETDGIEDASLMMGTAPNKEILAEAGLLTDDGKSAGPNDLIVALQGSTEGLDSAVAWVEAILSAGTAGTREGSREGAAPVAHSITDGITPMPNANLVLISTPGIYVKQAEARKALAAGRHVMIFSDNVSLEDEIALKRMASERGLLLMGPDCGTAIIAACPSGSQTPCAEAR